MNEGPSQAVSARVQLLTFRVADEWYALDVRCVRRVEPCPELTPVPGAPSAIPGVFASQGQLIAVLDPRAVLGLPAPAAGDQLFVVIARDGDLCAGLLADWVDEVVQVDAGAVEPPSAGASYATGLTHLRGALVSVLNAGALFAAVSGE